jgi:hypothetical protein
VANQQNAVDPPVRGASKEAMQIPSSRAVAKKMGTYFSAPLLGAKMVTPNKKG